jgi:hypothetical protein
MDILGRFRKPELDDDLREFERQLSAVLNPVVPRADFVSDLRFNLMRQNFKRVPVPEKKIILPETALIASGIVGIALALISGVRGIVSLVGVIGLLVSWLRQQEQQSAPSDFAQ